MDRIQDLEKEMTKDASTEKKKEELEGAIMFMKDVYNIDYEIKW